MRILVAGLTSEKQYVRAVHSFMALDLEEEDEKVFPEMGMRGDVARITVCNEFLKNEKWDALMMCDMDMVLPKDLVKRLRAHDLAMVAAHYFKRGTSPVQSVCAYSPDGTWPFVPLYDIPDGGLHEMAVAGFGSVLIKRHVIEDVAATLPEGTHPFAIGPMPEMTDGEHGNFGSDYYFFTRARNCGYKLYVDFSPDLECLHYYHGLVNRKLYEIMRPHQNDGHLIHFEANFKRGAELHGMNENTLENRIKILELKYREAEEQLETLKNTHAIIYGQLFEARELLKLEQAQKGTPEIKKIARVPVFSSREEAEKALANREGTTTGHTEEEMREHRTTGIRDQHKEILDAIS